MKNRMTLFSLLLLSATMFASPSLKTMNRDPGQGIDCELFLKPFLESELKDVSGQIILDAGNSLALKAIKDAEQLPFASNSVDKAFSVNISATIPTTRHIGTANQYQEIGFGAYFFELGRVMKEGGKLIIAAPASYDVVFTDGTCSSEEAMNQISKILEKIGTNQDPEAIIEHLSELTGVMRATFAFKDGSLQLVTNEKELQIGQAVWCKIPDGVISSVYHSEEEHLVAIKRAGLTCEEIKRPCFFGKVKYDMWHAAQSSGQSLGEAYISKNPFTLYYVVK